MCSKKEIAPKGSKFFPSRVDPFSKRDKAIKLHRVVSLNSDRCLASNALIRLRSQSLDTADVESGLDLG